MSLLCCQTWSPRCVWLGYLRQTEQHSPSPPQPEIRFSQITSEWMVNTACLASPANRGSSLHVDVPSHVSLDRFVWSVWRSKYKYLGMDNTYITLKHGVATTHASTQPPWQKKERNRWKTTMSFLMKIFLGCHGNFNSQPNQTFHHLSCKDGSCFSCPPFNSKMIGYQWSTQVHKRLRNLS